MGYTSEIIRYISIGIAALVFMGLGSLLDSDVVKTVGTLAGVVSLVGFAITTGHAALRSFRKGGPPRS